MLYAVAEGSLGVAQLLLGKGADPNVATKNDGTAMHIAAVTNGAAMIPLLISYGGNLETKHSDKTPLQWAIEVHDDDYLLDAIEELVASGASVLGVQDMEKYDEVVQAAIEAGKEEREKRLVDRGAPLDGDGDFKLSAPLKSSATVIPQTISVKRLELLSLLLLCYWSL